MRPTSSSAQLYHLAIHTCGPQTAAPQHWLQAKLSPIPGYHCSALITPGPDPSTPTRPAQSSLRACQFRSSFSSLRKQTISLAQMYTEKGRKAEGSCSRSSPIHSRGSVRLGSAQLPTVAPENQHGKTTRSAIRDSTSVNIAEPQFFIVKGGSNSVSQKVALRIKEMINDKIICKCEGSLLWHQSVLP